MALPNKLHTLQIKSLSLSLGNRQILSDINLNVAKGSITGLVGKSGSGKSSLMKTVLGYNKSYTIYSGTILIQGKNLKNTTRRMIQPVFQEPLLHFNPSWTLKEVLFEPLEINFANPLAVNLEKVTGLLRELGFHTPAILEKNIQKFSGGELQRFAIIRALLCDPGLILMDEPASALDVLVQRDFTTLIKKLVKNHAIAVLFISHDLDLVREICDFVYIIDQGRIVESGTVAKVFLEPSSRITRMLLDSRNLDDIRLSDIQQAE